MPGEKGVFDSHESACSISAEANQALSDDADKAGLHRANVFKNLAQLRVDFGQGAIDVLGDQLEKQDLATRVVRNIHTPSLPVCPTVDYRDLPVVAVGRDQNNHVQSITFMPSKSESLPSQVLIWRNWK